MILGNNKSKYINFVDMIIILPLKEIRNNKSDFKYATRRKEIGVIPHIKAKLIQAEHKVSCAELYN